jgi:hypothetical protein
VVGSGHTIVVIPAKGGGAVRAPGCSKLSAPRVRSAAEVYWIPASAGMTSVFMAGQRNHFGIT